jgi:putative endonuclease
MAWVYILKTESGKYYVGSTDNLDARLRHHFGGHTPSTSKLVPTSLALSQEYRTLQEARSVEQKIKNLKRRDYVEKILKDGYIKLPPG